MVKLAIATISFDDSGNRRTIYWYGEDADAVGQIFLEDENLDTDCVLQEANSKLAKAYPSSDWDLEFIPATLC